MRRIVQLTVGDRGSGDALVIRDLKINFTVDKQASAPHIALIQVTNLAPASRAAIESQFTSVLLEYGTSNGLLSIVFLGQLYNVVHTKNNSTGDIVTTLYCGSGAKARATGSIQQTFSAATSVGDLVRAVANQFAEYGVGRGTVVSGALSTIMENLLEGTGFAFNIEGDQVTVKAEVTADTSDIIVTPASGLIGSARRTHQGFDFTAVLNPAIHPNETVGVFSAFTEDTRPGLHYSKLRSDQGAYVRVLSLKHTGSNRDGAATTVVVGIR